MTFPSHWPRLVWALSTEAGPTGLDSLFSVISVSPDSSPNMLEDFLSQSWVLELCFQHLGDFFGPCFYLAWAFTILFLFQLYRLSGVLVFCAVLVLGPNLLCNKSTSSTKGKKRAVQIMQTHFFYRSLQSYDTIFQQLIIRS